MKGNVLATCEPARLYERVAVRPERLKGAKLQTVVMGLCLPLS